MSLIKSRRWINIDAEDEERCLVSSSASQRLVSTLPARREAVDGFSGIQIDLSGLKGGHSGEEIHENRSNAIMLMAHLLQALTNEGDVRIVSLAGGYAANAIPTDCQASIAVPQAEAERIQTLLETEGRLLSQRLQAEEPHLTLHYTSREVDSCLMAADSRGIVEALCTLPDGCIEMSEISPNIAGISLNNGIVAIQDEHLTLYTMIRSNKQEDIAPLVQQFDDLFPRLGGTCSKTESYGVWEYRENSPLREMFLSTFFQVAGFKPTITPTHCGTECSIFSSEIPDLDIICVGPTVHDVHTVHEKLDAGSVFRLYTTLCHLLRIL